MNKLKTILSVALIATSCLSVKAQDGINLMPSLSSTSVGQIGNLLANSPNFVPETNVVFIAYATHADGLVDSKGKDASWGGGFALVQPLNNYVNAGLRMQYLAGEVYVPSVTAQVQTTKNLFGIPKLFITTFGFGGAVLPIGGLDQDNGNAYLTYGAGFSIKYQVKENLEIGAGYGVEYWPGLNVNKLEHFGPVIRWRF